MKKIFSLFLALVLILSLFAGCGKVPGKTPDEPAGPVAPETPAEPEVQLTDAEILWARREAAEDYLRKLVTVRWRSDVGFSYESPIGTPHEVVAGRLCEGLPYSFGGATLGAWLDHTVSVDEKGVHNLEGLTKELLHGNSTSARLGIDCSGTVTRAWQSVGAEVRTESTNKMTPANGFLRVGDYVAPEDVYTNTNEDCKNNGTDVMYEAYAQLQKADAIVTNHGGGHTRFVVGVNVVRNEDGSIDGRESTVTILEQRSTSNYSDKEAGETVTRFVIGDVEYAFYELVLTGYLPVTNKIFVDPSPIEEPVVTDSIKEPSFSNLFSGTLQCNWALDNVTITITDASGAVVQASILHPKRRTELEVSMMQFGSDAAENKTVGVVSPLELPSGSYHCKVTCRTVAGHVLTAREFDFTM